MIIQISILNDLGKFQSEAIVVTTDEYKKLIEVSKGFYVTGFEMWIDNGFMVFPPEITKKSILTINVIEDGTEKEI